MTAFEIGLALAAIYITYIVGFSNGYCKAVRYYIDRLGKLE